MGRGLAVELLLRKDGGYAGYIVDMRTCMGMEVCMCTGGELRSRLVAVLALQGRLDLGDIQSGGNIWSTWYMCMNVGAGTWARMGDCMQNCWTILLCAQPDPTIPMNNCPSFS